jgi:hypothetical protein
MANQPRMGITDAAQKSVRPARVQVRGIAATSRRRCTDDGAHAWSARAMLRVHWCAVKREENPSRTAGQHRPRPRGSSAGRAAARPDPSRVIALRPRFPHRQPPWTRRSGAGPCHHSPLFITAARCSDVIGATPARDIRHADRYRGHRLVVMLAADRAVSTRSARWQHAFVLMRRSITGTKDTGRSMCIACWDELHAACL